MKTLKVAPFVFLVGLAPAVLAPFASARDAWPAIAPLNETITVANAVSPGAGLETTLSDEHGKPLYDLKCHNANYGTVDHQDVSVGLLQCRLTARYGKDQARNLLDDAKDPARGGHNRAAFQDGQLRPGCAQTVDWGAVRRFRLRNMELTLSMTDMVLAGLPAGKVKSYWFHVLARHVDDAQSEIAERIKTPEPRWFYTFSAPCRG